MLSHPDSSPEKPKIGVLELSATQEGPGLVLGANRVHTDKAWGCVVKDFAEEGWTEGIWPGILGVGSWTLKGEGSSLILDNIGRVG